MLFRTSINQFSSTHYAIRDVGCMELDLLDERMLTKYLRVAQNIIT